MLKKPIELMGILQKRTGQNKRERVPTLTMCYNYCLQKGVVEFGVSSLIELDFWRDIMQFCVRSFVTETMPWVLKLNYTTGLN